MAKLLRAPSGQLANILRFMSCGKGKSSGCNSSDPCKNKPDPCGNKPEPCGNKPNPSENKSDFCKSQDNMSAPEIDLGNPCSNPCSPPPTPPRESCVCAEPTIEFCPITEEMRARCRFWQFATFFGAIPAVILSLAIILPAHHESEKKPRQEYINYPFMHRITKPYWWGDGHHGIFFNPRVNPIPPHGYEVPDPYAIPENKVENENGNGKH